MGYNYLQKTIKLSVLLLCQLFLSSCGDAASFVNQILWYKFIFSFPSYFTSQNWVQIIY
jgi:hypothetical protein